MNKQEIFDRVWMEFYEGGRTPAFYSDTCVYNATKNKLKCAIGIQPEFQTIYNREMECHSIRTLWLDEEYQDAINHAFDIDLDDMVEGEAGMLKCGPDIPNDVVFLASLQDAHDMWAFDVDQANNWEKGDNDGEYNACLGILEDNLRTLAYDYSLDTP